MVAQIGPYKVLGVLGEGGMGVVYRAEHIETGQLAAVKTVRLFDAGQLENLRRETHALAQISHPGIVRILGSGMDEAMPWVAMELIEGVTLREVVLSLARRLGAEGRDPESAMVTRTANERAATPESPSVAWTRNFEAAAGRPAAKSAPEPASGRPPAAGGALLEALTTVRRLCAPLAYLHGEGIVHRDLKPANVILRPDKLPVLVDFGLTAQTVGALGRERIEAMGSMAGTLAYMAPEQARGQLVDARADLYSLGCILYELVTGFKPFSASSAEELVQQHRASPPPLPSDLVTGVEPRLEELILRLLAKRPQDRVGHADDVAAALGMLGAADWPGPELPRPRPYLYLSRFVGRQGVLKELRRDMGLLLQGVGGLVLIGGESGVGKTRLALELGREARGAGVRVVVGACRPETRDGGAPLDPLRPLLGLVADRCLEQGLEESERLLGPRGPLLALYEPALALAPGQEGHPPAAELAPEAAQLRLCSYLSETFRALTGSGSPGSKPVPLMVILDDLQWADEPTLGWLEYFARTATGPESQTALRVVGTYRTEDLGSPGHEPLKRLLEAPETAKHVLGRLDEGTVGSIVADMLALSPPPKSFVRYLRRRSEGNPFFVAELLRTAVTEGLLYRDVQGRWRISQDDQERSIEAVYAALPLPQSLREAVERRLRGLRPEAQELVSAAAILGRECPAPRLRRMLALEEAAFLEGLHELMLRQVLEEADGQLRFVHDQIRELAAGRLEPEHRRRLHEAAARAVEAEIGGQGPMLAILAQHWEAAGVPEKAADWFLRGAQQAADRFSYAEAERLYRASLAIAESRPEIQSAQVHIELAERVLAAQGRNEEAREEFRRGMEAARKRADRPGEAASLRGMALAEMDCGRLRDAAALGRRALVLHSKLGLRLEEARDLRVLGRIFHRLGPTEDALELYQQALQIQTELGDGQEAARTQSWKAAVHMERGQFEEAEAALRRALELLEAVGIRAGLGEVLGNLHSLLCLRGRHAEAAPWGLRALTLARETGDRLGEASMLNSLGTSHWVQGDPEKAEGLWTEALNIALRAGDRANRAVALSKLAAIDRDRGALSEARSRYREALELQRQMGLKLEEAYTLHEMVVLERRGAGDAEAAADLLEAAEKILRERASPLGLAKCLCERGHLALMRGRPAKGPFEEARRAAQTAGVGPESDTGQAIANLERAIAAAAAGEALVNGERVADLPEFLRRGTGH